MNIGLDFGTTNSILSFYDRNSDYVETYRLDGNAGANYIPSVVAFDDGDISIGDDAKNSTDDEDVSVYSRFKILLNLKDDDELLAHHGYKDKKPHEITAIYIKELISKFKSDYNLDKIDNLVLTIPEIWLRDDYQSRSILKRIIESLNLPLKKLVSEPVSAGAYFLYNYQKEMGKKFDGHVLVFDYGGGTLDVSLLETQNNIIKVLERTGMGKDDTLSGKAGVAFDERVINTMCGKRTSKLGRNYRVLLNEFERKKIETSRKHEKVIKNYKQDVNQNKRVFRLTCNDRDDEYIGTFNVYASNLVNAFRDLDKDIKSSLKEISKTFIKHSVQTDNADRFRVVMVGGFSNFYLSKRSVREFFGAGENDRRFQTHFKAEDIALAISKGASLIAEDIINIDETYPASLYLEVKVISEKNVAKDDNIEIFRQGDTVRTYDVNYIKKRISHAGQLIFKFDNGVNGRNFKIKIDKEAHKLYPNFDRPNNKWQIGFSIDKNSFIYVHIRDKYEDEKKTELGDILNEYNEGIVLVDEE